ncbi:competence protein ComEC [Devosia enhydra]|uniref:Competence protein ComEC n=1 Tax=Devosia enhydra TaxID=665118 RepID=A0A1K2HUQ7_9HYPH|nr:ComEC/Rec2 family competence protein [Devosia enhydra]SFZ82063.1 competence protein ComEC [Devosia enhydra]
MTGGRRKGSAEPNTEGKASTGGGPWFMTDDRTDLALPAPPPPALRSDTTAPVLRNPLRFPTSALRLRRRTLGLGAACTAALDARRLFCLVPFALLAGLIIYAALPVEPAPWALPTAALAVVLLALFRLIPTRPAVLTLSAAFGFALLPLHAALFATPMLAFPAYGAYEATIDEILSESQTERRMIVSAITPIDGARPLDIRRARIFAAADTPLRAGDRIAANFRLAPVPGPVLPGAFDAEFHAYFAGIGAYGTVTSDLRRIAPAEGFALSRAVDELRRSIGERISSVLSGPAAAIGWAMVVGDQSFISDEVREVMAASGLAHIYSISGLHLSIVAGGAFWLLRAGLALWPASVGWPIKKIAAVAGLLAASAYLMLAGGPANIPAFRSTLMLGLIFGAVLVGRRALTMRNVAIAAIVIILIDPPSIFRPSFQLSFAAVVALIGAYELPRQPRERARGMPSRMAGAIWATALTSLVAGLATLLFSAYHFQQTAPLGVVGNLMMLPVLTFVIMPFGVLSVLAMPLGLDPFLLPIMGWGIDRMLDIATLVTGWSVGLEQNPILAPAALVIGFAALGWFAFFPGWWRLAGPALAVPLIAFFGFDQRPDVIIADSTQAIAVRAGETYGLLAGRTGSFAVDVWSDHYRRDIDAQLSGARCDATACLHDGPQFRTALVLGSDAFSEDCAWAHLIVTRLRAPMFCAAPVVIDAGAIARGGVHWLRWSGDGFEIRTARVATSRPWRADLR